MNVDKALVFKSVDARKQNPHNKPGKFTVKFVPELILENNKRLFFLFLLIIIKNGWFFKYFINTQIFSNKTNRFK